MYENLALAQLRQAELTRQARAWQRQERPVERAEQRPARQSWLRRAARTELRARLARA